MRFSQIICATALCLAGWPVMGEAQTGPVTITHSAPDNVQPPPPPPPKPNKPALPLSPTKPTLEEARSSYQAALKASDTKQIFTLLDRACAGDYAPACVGYAQRREKRTDVPHALYQALIYWQRGCDLGDPSACFTAGERIRAGAFDSQLSTVAERKPQAAAWDAKGCERDNVAACLAFGDFLLRQRPLTRTDLVTARAVYRRLHRLRPKDKAILATLRDVERREASMAKAKP